MTNYEMAVKQQEVTNKIRAAMLDITLCADAEKCDRAANCYRNPAHYETPDRLQSWSNCMGTGDCPSQTSGNPYMDALNTVCESMFGNMNEGRKPYEC